MREDPLEDNIISDKEDCNSVIEISTSEAESDVKEEARNWSPNSKGPID